MSIQRYAVRKDALVPEETAFPRGYGDLVVRYADHVAAVAAARAEVGEDRVLGDVMAEHYRNAMTGPTQLSVSDEEEVYSLMQAYQQGQRDSVKAAREAVADCFPLADGEDERRIRAAIDGVSQ